MVTVTEHTPEDSPTTPSRPVQSPTDANDEASSGHPSTRPSSSSSFPSSSLSPVCQASFVRDMPGQDPGGLLGVWAFIVANVADVAVAVYEYAISGVNVLESASTQLTASQPASQQP